MDLHHEELKSYLYSQWNVTMLLDRVDLQHTSLTRRLLVYLGKKFIIFNAVNSNKIQLVELSYITDFYYVFLNMLIFYNYLSICSFKPFSGLTIFYHLPHTSHLLVWSATVHMCSCFCSYLQFSDQP